MAKRCGMTIICLCISSGSPPLDDKKAQNDHNFSLRAIGHDCLRMAKRCGMTIICLRMSHDLRVRMTEIVGWPIKAKLFLLRMLNLCWGTQNYVVLDNCETKIVSVFSSLKMRTCFIKETKLPADQSNTCFLDEKQCVYRGRRVCWWNFLITINEILDVSILLLNDHLEETPCSTKIEENHSKCINLIRVSVSS